MRFFSYPRTYKVSIQAGSDSIGVDVNFYRSNSSIDLRVDPRAAKHVTGKFTFKSFKNAAESSFVKANLELDGIESHHLSIVNQYKRIIPRSACSLFSNETIILGKTKTDNGDFFQKVQVFIFVKDLSTYIHAERHFIDMLDKKKIVKSVGAEIQFTPFSL